MGARSPHLRRAGRLVIGFAVIGAAAGAGILAMTWWLGRTGTIIAASVETVWVTHLVARIVIGRPRFFTLDQRRIVGDAFGANCVWRRCNWLPAIPAVFAFDQAFATHSPAWRVTSEILLVVTAIGTPVSRHAWSCGGTIQGGHQVSAADLGTTSIFNCEPCCGRHNRLQSAAWSWTYALRQWGPISFVPYAFRNWLGTVRLVWRLMRDSRARELSHAE